MSLAEGGESKRLRYVEHVCLRVLLLDDIRRWAVQISQVRFRKETRRVQKSSEVLQTSSSDLLDQFHHRDDPLDRHLCHLWLHDLSIFQDIFKPKAETSPNEYPRL